MPILNYTTKVSVEKTVAEIQKALARAGATSIMTEYDSDANLKAIAFRIPFHSQSVAFLLPARIDAVYRILCNETQGHRFKTREQATRVAWRIVKDWILAQIALVEAEQADLAQVFLPYAQNPMTGKTLYQTLESDGPLLLGYDG